MGLNNFNYVDGSGSTLLTGEEREGLKIKSITTHRDLNEYEQANIADALTWLKSKRNLTKENILTQNFIKDLHKQMFNKVWLWAGKVRLSNKNIGNISWPEITTQLENLLRDVLYWIENKTFNHEEIAIRFKHRLVFIHPFPNGNGRHSRIMADILMERVFSLNEFSWGENMFSSKEERSDFYIKSLHKADNGDFSDLLKFAKS